MDSRNTSARIRIRIWDPVYIILLYVLNLSLFHVSGVEAAPPGTPVTGLSEPQSIEHIFAESIRMYGAGNHTGSILQLRKIESVHPGIFRVNNGYYLLGRSLLRVGNYSEAIRSFQVCLSDESMLTDYIRFDMAECYKHLEMYELALKELRKIDHDPINGERDITIGEICRLQGKHLLAIEHWKKLKLGTSSKSTRRQLDIKIAGLYEEMGEIDRALDIYYAILDYGELNQETFQSITQIEKLESTTGYQPEINSNRLFLRAQTKYNLGLYQRAAKTFKDFLDRYPNDERVSDAYYRLGRCYYRDELYLQAVESYQAGVNRFSSGRDAKRSRYQMALCLFQLNEDEKARWQLNKILSMEPAHYMENFALYELGQYYEKTGHWAKSLRYYRDLVNRFPRNSLTDNALWNQARVLIRLKEYDDALDKLHRIIHDFNTSDLLPDAGIWQGICYFLKDDKTAAQKVFRGFLNEYPRHYYTYYARDYLRKLTGGALSTEQETNLDELIRRAKNNLVQSQENPVLDELVQAFLLYPESRQNKEMLYLAQNLFDAGEDGVKIRSLTEYSARPFFTDEDSGKRFWNSVASSEAFKRGLELYSLGDMDRGFQEIKTAWDNNPGDMDLLYNLVLLAHHAERYYDSIKYAQYLVNRLTSKRNFFLLPDRIKKFLYPIGFPDTIKKMASEYQLEPEIIAAIIYQESRFKPDAVSPAAAKGLMQIIPRTGKQIAQAMEKKDYQEDHLLNPHISIEMGTWYFKDLVNQFQGRLEVALASYNGGPQNAKRWLELCETNTVLEFIGSITFKETRNYVKIVMQNFFIYKDLYKSGATWPDTRLNLSLPEHDR